MVNGKRPQCYTPGVDHLERCGRYELVQRLALGGMAEIFLARETGLAGFERLVIIKRVLPGLSSDTDFIDMFLDEARLAARLTHPNIVHIYELGEQEGTYFIAMEYVPGGDLFELLGQRSGGLLPLGESLHVISEVCAGLQFAHALAGPDGASLGVVHRDVTPKNVLLSVDGVIKVVDFGIAKARAKLSVTKPGDIKGTFSYMAPEQARGEAVDRRADVYAVGALLYRLTTGSPAYPQAGNALLSAVRSGQFAPPRSVNPNLPTPIEGIVLKAMAPRAGDRYATCGALRRDISDVLRELGAHPDSEAIAAVVRQAFPRVPGATAPLDELPSGPPATSIETPVRRGLAPAGPNEATGLVALGPGEQDAAFGDLDSIGLATTEMLPPSSELEPEDKTTIVPISGGGTPGAAQGLGGLPSVIADDDDDVPTGIQVVEIEPDTTRDDAPTRSFKTPVGQRVSSPSVGPPPPLSHPSTSPPAAVEAGLIVGSGTPTATPVYRPKKRVDRRGTLVILLAFGIGALLIAAAVGLVMISPSRSQLPMGGSAQAGAQGLALPALDGAVATTALDARGDEPEALSLTLPSDGSVDVRSSTRDGGPTVDPSPSPPIRVAPPTPRESVARSKINRPRGKARSVSPKTGGRAVIDAADPPRSTEPREPGFLTVWTTPYSKVYLGGRLLGTTPMAKREVPAGRHRLRLVNPDHPEKTVSVTVRAGEVTRVRQSL